MQMEGAKAGFAFASGMAAVYSTMAALLNLAIILFLRAVFWSNPFVVYELFPKWNIETPILISTT
jgi:O-succinylhomoserine sulfhydrylase